MTRIILSAFLLAGILVSCSQNALTGKSQFTLLPESELQSMATQEYATFLSSNKVVAANGNKDAEMVKRVGQRIVGAVNAYYQQNGLSDKLTGYKWEYNLVNDPTVNAWCMPGGKIVVYTGLLPITQHALKFYGHIGYHAYEGIALDLEERERLVASLGTHRAMILRNHGLLAAGRTIAEAFLNIYFLERACQAQIKALAGGRPLSYPSAAVCERTAAQFNREEGLNHAQMAWESALRLIA